MPSTSIDDTHDASRISWLDAANGHPDFPMQNLPWGVFLDDAGKRHAGIAVGDAVIDLAALAATGLLHEACRPVATALHTDGGMMALAPADRLALRRTLFALLDSRGPRADEARRRRTEYLRPMAECRMALPARIGNYTDFNAGIHHSARGGLRRGRSRDEALLPNYRHVPIAYHGRASSVRPSGTAVRRPWGQLLEGPGQSPVFQPSNKLDFELELAIWVGADTALGEPVPLRQVPDHIAGFSLLNDWSARDIQAWESDRLGPFLGKSFGTIVSPWVVTPEAMAPFRAPAFARTGSDPQPLPYLLDAQDQAQGGLDLVLEVWLTPAGEKAPALLATSHARHLYWTPAQMLAHHTSNGCNVHVGDLLGTGTVSGPQADAFGTLLDAIEPDRPAVRVGPAERVFLADGDEIILRAHTSREGFARIGFGDCRSTILPPVAAFA